MIEYTKLERLKDEDTYSMEKLLEEISFTATDRSGETVIIDADNVRNQVGDLVKDADLSKFIL